jgi:hypothetical protein
LSVARSIEGFEIKSGALVRVVFPTIAFGATAIVLEVHENGVLQLPGLSQRIDDPTNASVHLIHHRGIDFHATNVPGHQTDAGLMRVETGQQRCPGRTTARGVVELRESDTVIGHNRSRWGVLISLP